LDWSYAQRDVEIQPGSYAMLAISDTGMGMEKETMSNLFEPFFTTKEQGKGTGLGLPTVYGIVRQHDGYIWPYSEPGQGTTFKIYLPLVDPASGTRQMEDEAASLDTSDVTETILLAEDERAVRTLTRTVLERRGYTVLAARNGEEALALSQEHTGPIHLLVTDVVMPGIDGRELADRLASVHPETRVLFTSGHTEEAIDQHGALDDSLAFLHKPFAPDTLARAVRQVLTGEYSSQRRAV
jgi:CheY-like chemotaxis protein